MDTSRLLLIRDWGTIKLPFGTRFAPDDSGSGGPSGSTEPSRSGEDEKPLRILLVEDDVALAGMYQRRLEHSGHEVAVAHDGESGLARIRDERFDLVFLDIGLPKIDGIAVLEAVRADAQLTKLPVVILSNYDEPEMVARSRELGVLEYIVKAHTTPGQVADKVRRFSDSAAD